MTDDAQFLTIPVETGYFLLRLEALRRLVEESEAEISQGDAVKLRSLVDLLDSISSALLKDGCIRLTPQFGQLGLAKAR